MNIKSFSYFPSHMQFLNSCSTLESLYRKYRDAAIPLNREDFSGAFFDCFDYLTSLSPDEMALLKSDVLMHCKIVIFDSIKLHLMAENPQLRKIPGFQRIF